MLEFYIKQNEMTYNIKLKDKRSILFKSFLRDSSEMHKNFASLLNGVGDLKTNVNLFVFDSNGNKRRLGICVNDTDINVSIVPFHLNTKQFFYDSSDYIIIVDMLMIKRDTIEELSRFEILEFDKKCNIVEFSYKENMYSLCSDKKVLITTFKEIEAFFKQYLIVDSEYDVYKYFMVFALFAKYHQFVQNNHEFIRRLYFYIINMGMESLMLNKMNIHLYKVLYNSIVYGNQPYEKVKNLLSFYCGVSTEICEYGSVYGTHSRDCIRVGNKLLYLYDDMTLKIDKIMRYNNSYMVTITYGGIIDFNPDFVYFDEDNNVELSHLSLCKYLLFNNEKDLRKYLILN